MSDAHGDEKKDKKDDKKEAAPAAAPGGIKALLGPVAAVAVLIGAGGGIGFFIAGALKPAGVTPPGEGAAAGGHDAHGSEGHDGGGDAHGGQILTDVASPLAPIALKTNVTGQGGNRFSTATVTLWVEKSVSGHFGEETMITLIQSKLEEQFKSYSFEELTGAAIHQRLRKDFKVVAEKLFHSLHKGKASSDPKTPAKPLVYEAVITDLLVQ